MCALVVIALIAGAGTSARTAVPTQSLRVDPIRTWIFHYDSALADIGAETFEQLLRRVPPTASVIVAVRGEEDEADFRNRMDVPATRWSGVQFLATGRPLSAWARDRYTPFCLDGTPAILLPGPRTVPTSWHGDLVVAETLGTRHPQHRLVHSGLSIEGGDLLIGQKLALVGEGTIQANLVRLGTDAEAVRRELAHILGRRVIVVDAGESEAPHDHIDMTVHLVDDRTALVGDPRASLAVWDDQGVHKALSDYGAPTRAEQQSVVAAYDGLARSLRRHGLRVLRVPAVHGRGSDVVLSWTNAVIDAVDGQPTVYLPNYGLPSLDVAAARVWRGLGFQVIPIPVGAAALEGGALRCLTNVIRRRHVDRTRRDVIGTPIAKRGSSHLEGD